jgi:uncharacterized membrane protein
MSTQPRSIAVSVQRLMAWACGVLCLLIMAPPILASNGFNVAAAGIYLCFSCICHQLPGRVFTLLGFPLAVCHRCCGIYLGFFLGSFIRNPWMHRSPAARRKWILAALAPLAFDALAPYCGLWTNTCGTRFLTGLVFGIIASSLLMQGLAEFIIEAPWRRLLFGESRLRGGLS